MHKRLYFATTNDAKVESLRRYLEPHGFEVTQAPFPIPEPRFQNVRDTALLKVMFAWAELGEPVVANDAGFFVHQLNDFPGTFVNFSLKSFGIRGILRLASDDDRQCEFRHALAYHDGGPDAPAVFTDRVLGSLSPEPRGIYDPSYHWSELVRIFIPEGETKTLGEMSHEEYLDWNEHRRPKPSYADLFLKWREEHRTLSVP